MEVAGLCVCRWWVIRVSGIIGTGNTGTRPEGKRNPDLPGGPSRPISRPTRRRLLRSSDKGVASNSTVMSFLWGTVGLGLSGIVMYLLPEQVWHSWVAHAG